MKVLNALHHVTDYASYLIRSTNRHGLHSPFVYNLNEAVFRKDVSEPVHAPIEQRRTQLLSDDREIKVTDFGAGSQLTVSPMRKISSITAGSSKQKKYARALYRLVKYLQPSTMLEFGTSVGISALYQSLGNPSGKLITLEGCEHTASVASQSFTLFPQLNITQAIGEFSKTLPGVLADNNKLDYVFIDGNHRRDAVISYFNAVFPHLSEQSVVIVDDINWSGDMKTAWSELKSDARVRISIDIFQMGLLFFGKGFSKEDFIIRY